MSETPSLENRLNYLEEQNEALKRSGLLLVILVLVMGVTMIFQSRTASAGVSTDGLILNDAGRPKAALTAMPSGHLGLVFYDFSGNLPQQIQYNSIPYLDGIAIYDRQGRPRILMGIDDKDNPILAIVSAEGKTLFSAVTPSTSPPTQTAEPVPEPTPKAVATPDPDPTP
jgi:hypothetical protein